MVQGLAAGGLFGRALPAREQAFVVVTDSVAKQLDGLKNDRALSGPVRRFWSAGLDACGPAGAPSCHVGGTNIMLKPRYCVSGICGYPLPNMNVLVLYPEY